jgi:hypothetical protein
VRTLPLAQTRSMSRWTSRSAQPFPSGQDWPYQSSQLLKTKCDHINKTYTWHYNLITLIEIISNSLFKNLAALGNVLSTWNGNPKKSLKRSKHKVDHMYFLHKVANFKKHCAMIILINQLKHLDVISYNLLAWLLGNHLIIIEFTTRFCREYKLETIMRGR